MTHGAIPDLAKAPKDVGHVCLESLHSVDSNVVGGPVDHHPLAGGQIQAVEHWVACGSVCSLGRATGPLWASAGARLRWRSAVSRKHATASRARVRLTMSLRLPSGQRTRHMPRQLASGTTLGLSSRLLMFCGVRFWKNQAHSTASRQ